ncbi:hypothetical protein OH76DRAFT_314170 [Lentinus brumalis]|uniref:Uncharacterized protein n=1 Tax=Lentinus brumalis TaxID=2498619 RepID=A0A371CK22_9APHY|nr:hypothetical protein OH76DRAFT_314170 [Polyporus brumalis]
MRLCEETRPTARLVDLRFCPALQRCKSVKNCDQTRRMTHLIAIVLCPRHGHALSPGRLIERAPKGVPVEEDVSILEETTVYSLEISRRSQSSLTLHQRLQARA